MAKQDLSKLPMHIRQLNKFFFYDSRTGKKIHRDRIQDHLPKEEVPVETKTYWWNNL